MVNMKWTIVMLPVGFKQFELVYTYFIYSATIFFFISLSIGKRPILANIWGGCYPLHSYGPETDILNRYINVCDSVNNTSNDYHKYVVFLVA